MRGILFCNGEIRDYGYYESKIRPDDYIIAVDGGGRHCRALSLIPSLALGDFDSLPEDIYSFYRGKNIEFLEFPREKDYIDLALGIEEAIKRKCQEIVIYGALGGPRVDMEIGNVLLLSLYDADILMENENSAICCIDPAKPLVIKNKRGYYLSILPLESQLLTAASEGLLYPLKDLCINFGETRGISNEITDNYCRIEIKQGKALAIWQKNNFSSRI